MLIPVAGPGNIGFLPDLSPEHLPLEAWSGVSGGAFRLGKAFPVEPIRAFWDPSAGPHGIFSAFSVLPFWIYAGRHKVYGVLGTQEADITRTSGQYSLAPGTRWAGGVFNGIPYLSNPNDIPQVWNPPSLSQKLVDLPNWNPAWRTKVLRHFKNYMVAIASEGDHRRIRWSHPAPPGSVPPSWNEADPTKDAGVVSLAEGEESLVDCLPLGDINVVYTETSSWAMRLVGGASIFAFYRLFDLLGLLAIDCAASLRGRHFVVSQDDIVLHDGSSVESIADKRVRRWFFNNLDSTYFWLTTVVALPRLQEIWVCFPPSGSSLIERALVWNWGSNTWGVRDIPSSYSLASTRLPLTITIDSWDQGPAETWDEENQKIWQSSEDLATSESLLAASPIPGDGIWDEAFQSWDTGPDEAWDSGPNGMIYRYTGEPGLGVTAVVERTGISAKALSGSSVVADPTTVGILRGVWVLATGSSPIVVEVGAHDSHNSQPVWGQPQVFNPGADVKVDVYAVGRYFGIRFTLSGDATLLGYYLDVVPEGSL